MEKQKQSSLSYVAKVWTAVGITAFTVIMILLIYRTFNVFLLLLAASLIALFFNAVSNKIRKWTGLKDGVSLAVTIMLIFLLAGLFFWLVGAEAQKQFKELQEAVPVMIDNAQVYLNKTTLGQKISRQITDIENQFFLLCFFLFLLSII